jgi:zinc transport system ATP-binding protein
MTDASLDPLVTIERVGVVRQGQTLLDGLSFDVPRHSLHVVVGPNGAGKTTLIATILGQLPFTGRILLNWKGRGAIGYVPQSFAVDPTLPVTVEDFLALTRQRRPICLGVASATKATVRRLLDRVGLPDIAMRPLAVLSGGELRRVLLAHALDPEPELLILDEPTAGLDDASSAWLEETLRSLRSGRQTTVLMVSHDLEQVRRLADRVTVIDRRLLGDGPPATLLADHRIADLLPRQPRLASS